MLHACGCLQRESVSSPRAGVAGRCEPARNKTQVLFKRSSQLLRHLSRPRSSFYNLKARHSGPCLCFQQRKAEAGGLHWTKCEASLVHLANSSPRYGSNQGGKRFIMLRMEDLRTNDRLACWNRAGSRQRVHVGSWSDIAVYSNAKYGYQDLVAPDQR
jgi:hypothetical protein